MTSHRVNPRRGELPNWLKAWYAFLVFLAFITIMTLLLEGGT
jgi:hypothetical protein